MGTAAAHRPTSPRARHSRDRQPTPRRRRAAAHSAAGATARPARAPVYPPRPPRGQTPPPCSGAAPRRYRTLFLPEHRFTVYLPAPFRTIHTYTYGADGRINPTPTTRRG